MSEPGDDSGLRSGARLPRELLRDEHVDAVGWRAVRVLLRLSDASRGTRYAWSSAGWIAYDFSRRADGSISPRRHDSSGVRHALAELEAAGYLRRTGRTETRLVEGRRVPVYEYELLRERWEVRPAETEARDPQSRPQGGVIHSHARDWESREGVTGSHAKTRDKTRDPAAAARASDAPRAAAAAKPLPTEASTLASFFDPMPLELARAWFGWWFPTDRVGLSEVWAMGERHRTIRHLVALWDRFRDPEDWRVMFRDVQRSELRSIRGLEATLARIGANRAQQRAPQAAALAAHPPERTCTVAGCTARATHRHRHSGARYCGSHAAHAARSDPSLRQAIEELDDAEPAAPRAAAPTTREPREVPIVQQRARERPPRADAAPPHAAVAT